jgi:hypothetical protein
VYGFPGNIEGMAINRKSPAKPLRIVISTLVLTVAAALFFLAFRHMLGVVAPTLADDAEIGAATMGVAWAENLLGNALGK